MYGIFGIYFRVALLAVSHARWCAIRCLDTLIIQAEPLWSVAILPGLCSYANLWQAIWRQRGKRLSTDLFWIYLLCLLFAVSCIHFIHWTNTICCVDPVGLEFFSKQEGQSSAIRKAIKAILPRKRTISAKHFHEIQPTLIAACAGK